MEINEKSIQEALVYYSAFDFQWVKGDDTGIVEAFKNISPNGEIMFIEFQSGKRINSELLDEFMIMIPASPKVIEMEAPSQQSQPQHIEKKSSSVSSIIYDQSPQNDSPIYKLLKKQKENMVEVSIKIKLNLPPKELYSVLSVSFEDAEKEIIDFVLDGVDIEDIKASLAKSIKKSYYEKAEKPKQSPSSTGEKRVSTVKQYEESDDE